MYVRVRVWLGWGNGGVRMVLGWGGMGGCGVKGGVMGGCGVSGIRVGGGVRVM